MKFLDSRIGRIVLHLLAYGAAAFAVAVLTETDKIDFGQYEAIATLLIGATLDFIRKATTPL